MGDDLWTGGVFWRSPPTLDGRSLYAGGGGGLLIFLEKSVILACDALNGRNAPQAKHVFYSKRVRNIPGRGEIFWRGLCWRGGGGGRDRIKLNFPATGGEGEEHEMRRLGIHLFLKFLFILKFLT